MSIRAVADITAAVPTVEGAGVMLRRAFGFGKTSEFDPFLLFDDFRGDQPEDYQRGFPWHPHRGIETITYLLAGEVEQTQSSGPELAACDAGEDAAPGQEDSCRDGNGKHGRHEAQHRELIKA